ncbi:MAG: type IV toxin-antitoxin system AbiEi family antitoxin domain-containing protein [Thermoleophilaceae bacterium]
MGVENDTVERKLARIASAAHGVVTRTELLDAGVSRKEIEQRLKSGALIRQHVGVYRVGHYAPSVEARYMAAVKACGEGAVLSGLAAAHLLGLLKGRPRPPEVTAPHARKVDGVKTRRSRQIDATEWKRIPVTTAPRTLVDIAGDIAEDELARACHQAGVRFRTTPRRVEAVLEKRPKARGAAKLRRIISGDSPIILSKLEKRFLKLLREAGLTLPRTNRPKDGHYIDCRWPEHKLTVELDSYRFHSSRYAWEQDHRREREARARGDEFRRYTWSDVFEEPAPTLAEVRNLLGRVEAWTQAPSTWGARATRSSGSTRSSRSTTSPASRTR